MWSVKLKLVFLTGLLFVYFVANVSFLVFAVSETDAKSAIAAAEDKVLSCYEAAAKASDAGANATETVKSS